MALLLRRCGWRPWRMCWRTPESQCLTIGPAESISTEMALTIRTAAPALDGFT